jgi:uncharacterized protein involved in type VI secretion and phage assembly
MAITAEEILDNITRYGIEFYRVYPGLYRGIVTRNDDPQQQGRVQIHVAAMQDDAPDLWVKAATTGAGDGRGVFWPPEVGDPVFVSFAQGQPGRPECYIGGWFARRDDSSDVPDAFGYSEGYPDKRGLVTRMGHKLVFSDAEDDERVELVWNKADTEDDARTDRTKTAATGAVARGGGSASIRFTPDGSIEITDNANPNQTIKLDAGSGEIEIADKSGNKVVLSSTGAKIESTAIDLGGGATEPGLKGQTFLTWALAHVHPTTSPGAPTGPPGPPGPILNPTSVLTQVVKLK